MPPILQMNKRRQPRQGDWEDAAVQHSRMVTVIERLGALSKAAYILGLYGVASEIDASTERLLKVSQFLWEIAEFDND